MVIDANTVVSLLPRYRYAIFFPAAIIEGPIVTVIAGFFASIGYLNVGIVYALAVLGDATGDSLLYAAGRFGKYGLVDRYGPSVGLSPARLERLEKHFKRHGAKTLLIGKLTHGIGAGILIAAGAAEMPYGIFFLVNLLGTLPKSMVFLLIGWYFGRSYKAFNSYLDVFAIATLTLAVLFLIVYGVRRKVRLEDARDDSTPHDL